MIVDWSSTGRGLIIAIGLIAWSFESAVAQSLTPGPPGPYVIDFRGATSGVPTTAELYPDLTLEDSVPTRGFGFDVGAHVYRFHLGAARFGLGANYVRVRGTAGGAAGSGTAVARRVRLAITCRRRNANSA